jgi:hypothetical protein
MNIESRVAKLEAANKPNGELQIVVRRDNETRE